jgi:hypothetical protein
LSPHTTGAGSVYAQVVTKARATWPPTGRCGNFLYKSALVSEPRSYTQLGGLHGLNHCELAELPESLHESALVTAAAVLLLGLSEEALTGTLATLMERTDTPWEATLEIPLQTGGTAGLYAPVSPR